MPDLLTLAKGLGSGLPIGAVITTGAVGDRLAVGDLGSTFGGGPVPCAAAIATLEVIDRDDLVQNAVRIGRYIHDGALAAGVPSAQGRGLLIGLRLGRPAAPVQRALFERRILTGTASDPEVLRLMPPLSFSRVEADLLLDGLREALG